MNKRQYKKDIKKRYLHLSGYLCTGNRLYKKRYDMHRGRKRFVITAIKYGMFCQVRLPFKKGVWC